MGHIYDVIIIGGGPAGYTAALYAARSGFDTLVLEKYAPGGQMALTNQIDNYPGFTEGIDGFTLGMKMQEGAEKYGAKTEYTEVQSVELSGEIKHLVTDSGDLYARAVIIATGAYPRKLGVKDEDKYVGRGIHYCAHCDGNFYKNKNVIVVGGGNSAVSDAGILSRIANKVYLVHRRDTLRATKIYHDMIANNEKIEFKWNSAVDEIIYNDKFDGVILKNLKTDEKEKLDVDAVFVSIGRNPASDLFKGQIALDDAGYIIADETTKTNVEGVYVVGDVRTKAVRQIVTAVSDGAVAVHHLEEYLSK